MELTISNFTNINNDISYTPLNNNSDKLIINLSQQIYINIKSIKLLPNIIDLEFNRGCFAGYYNLEIINLSDLTGLTTLLIRENAFHKCYSIRSIELPQNLRSLKLSNRCFGDCSSIKTFQFPSSLTELSFGENCFSKCSNLEILQLKSKLTNLAFGVGCFSGCDKLQIIDFANINAQLTEKTNQLTEKTNQLTEKDSQIEQLNKKNRMCIIC